MIVISIGVLCFFLSLFSSPITLNSLLKIITVIFIEYLLYTRQFYEVSKVLFLSPFYGWESWENRVVELLHKANELVELGFGLIPDWELWCLYLGTPWGQEGESSLTYLKKKLLSFRKKMGEGGRMGGSEGGKEKLLGRGIGLSSRIGEAALLIGYLVNTHSCFQPWSQWSLLC